VNVDFARLFSMGGFEALRVLRAHQRHNPGVAIRDIAVLSVRVEADVASLDFEAAFALAEIVADGHVAPDGVGFYQYCIEAVVLARHPTWAKMMTYGRQKFVQKLSRDEQQCFRGAGLLEDPPSWPVIAWWDRVTNRVRLAGDQLKLERARKAEELSLIHETSRLRELGITLPPRWTAIEDNQAGYDIHSYDKGIVEPTARLIEVKSTIASPLRFMLTRHEWDQAVKFGTAYHFHVWDMTANPPRLFERTAAAIAPHVPSDNEKGKWKIAEIPIGVAPCASS
jgi:hypothetical protein